MHQINKILILYATRVVKQSMSQAAHFINTIAKSEDGKAAV